MKNPTQEQITAEIEKLREMKPRVISRSAFGDDHHAAIDAQIEVLEQDIYRDEIYNRFPGEEEEDGLQNVQDEALNARNRMDGESSDIPSAGWASLVR